MPASPSQLDLFAGPAEGPSAAPAREFLGWSSPALPVIADWLIARSGDAAAIDLRATVVALPTSRAARRLLELLVARADVSERPLFPPKLITVGSLPDIVAASAVPLAGTTTRRIVWAEALRSMDDDTLGRIVAHAPASADWAAWAALGKVMDDLHAELAKADLSFDGVATLGLALADFPDEARWQAMERVAAAYVTRLSALGLADPERARREALSGAIAFPRPGTATSPEGTRTPELVLACVADLAPSTRRLIDRLCAAGGARVTALIFAPEALAERFDAHGCILAAAWTDAPLVIPDESLIFAEGPDDQAARVVGLLAGFGGDAVACDYAAEDIVIGAPDAEIVPFVLERLDDAGLPGRDAAGVPAGRTAPARFLREAAAWVTHGEFASLAALVRHPDVEERIAVEDDVITPLDEYNSQHVQRMLIGAADHPALRGDEREVARVSAVLSRVEALVRPLRGGARPLAAWAEPIANTLIALYGGRELDPTEDDDRLIAGGVGALRAVLRELHALVAASSEESLAQNVDPESAVRIVLDAVADVAVPPSAEHAAIEVLGWLELPLDDAPALIVTGFVESRLPGSVNADPFLPDRLRQHLGLDDNARRHARDAYALSAVLASRPYVRLLAGRRDASGTPLTPSRLALAGDADTIARRLLGFYRREGAPQPVPISRRLVPGREQSAILVPRPPEDSTSNITKLSVTAFRDYLACPYRFWLRHVRKLQSLADDAVELDARLFGSLAHAVLADFGGGSAAASTSADEIAAWLDAALDARVAASFGEGAFPAVRVQAAQLRERLHAFAQLQAGWTASGKRIVAIETGTGDANSARGPQGAALSVDGEPFLLSGRIDRIDRDERTGALYVLDYKLSENARTPEQAHRKQGAWIDLQLPLYLHILRARPEWTEGAEVHVGYVSLPRDVRATQVSLAEWSSAELAEADAIAADVVRDVRRGRFWPPASPPPSFSEIYADICQDTKLGAAPPPEQEEHDTSDTDGAAP